MGQFSFLSCPELLEVGLPTCRSRILHALYTEMWQLQEKPQSIVLSGQALPETQWAPVHGRYGCCRKITLDLKFVLGVKLFLRLQLQNDKTKL